MEAAGSGRVKYSGFVELTAHGDPANFPVSRNANMENENMQALKTPECADDGTSHVGWCQSKCRYSPGWPRLSVDRCCIST